MRGEFSIALTPAGRCHNPTCGAPVFAELIDPDAHGYNLCPTCEEKHGDRLRERIAAAEGRPHCSAACCRRKAA